MVPAPRSILYKDIGGEELNLPSLWGDGDLEEADQHVPSRKEAL